MNNKLQIKNKVITNCIGALDFYDPEDSIEKTRPLVEKLYDESKTVDEFVDMLIYSDIFNIQVMFNISVHQKAQWDCCECSLVDFLSRYSSYNFVFDSFISFFDKVRSDGVMSNILFIKKAPTKERRQELREWLFKQ